MARVKQRKSGDSQNFAGDNLANYALITRFRARRPGIYAMPTLSFNLHALPPSLSILRGRLESPRDGVTRFNIRSNRGRHLSFIRVIAAGLT